MKNSKIKILQVLERARKRLSKEENWNRNSLYRPDTNTFCLLGALLPEKEIQKHKKIYPTFRYTNYYVFGMKNSASHDAALVLAKELNSRTYQDVYTFNDRHKYKEVMEVLDRAINNLKQQITNK